MVIGIDTSGSVCSVACVENGIIISERSINDKKTHSATLVPLLDEMLKDKGLSVSEASLFAVAKGPGSFTGLRIGTATAKGLSLALNTPIVGVSTLAALSFNLRSFPGIICPIMDARRSEVYTAAFDYCDKSQEMETIDSPVISPVAEPLNNLLEDLSKLSKESGKEVIFLGDAVPVYGDYIREKADFGFSFAPEELSLQHASSVAIIGEMLARRGESGPSNSLRLEYLRRPQAERERLGL